MTSVRSPIVTVRAIASGGVGGGGTIRTRSAEGGDEHDRVERRERRGSRTGERRRLRRCRFASEQPEPDERSLLEPQATVPERPVEDEAGAELGLGVAALVRELRGGLRGAAREHRPALDEDELARDGDERRDVADPVALEPGQRLQVGPGEDPERHREHVELLRLDEREQQSQRPVEGRQAHEGGGLGTSPLAEDHRGWRHGHDRGADDRLGHVTASSARLRAIPAPGSRGSAW